MEIKPIVEPQNLELDQTGEPIKPNYKQFKVAVILGVIVTLLLILFGLPPIRDYILISLTEKQLLWLRDNKQIILSWTEWLRITFEVALGLLISNQIFNDSLRSWFVEKTQSIYETLNAIVDRSIRNNDARVRIRSAILDIIVSVSGSRKFHQIPADLFDMFITSQRLAKELETGIWFLFVRLIFLKLLNAFSGRLHAIAALFSFLGVLSMKIVKLYLDSSTVK